MPRSSSPKDVLQHIITFVAEDKAYATLATLQCCNSELYFLVQPILFKILVVKDETAQSVLSLGDLSNQFGDGSNDLERFTKTALGFGRYFGSQNQTLRRMNNLRHVQTLIVETLPSDTLMQSFQRAGRDNHRTTPSRLLLPNVSSISFLPGVIDSLRLWIPDSPEEKHPFMDAVTLTSNPEHFCVSFPLVASTKWENHALETSMGQYRLVSILSQCRAGLRWSNLRRFRCHNVVHQALPTITGCQNFYDFSPHVASPSPPGFIRNPPRSPTSAKEEMEQYFISGPESIGLPGPDWNLRSWQITKVIKEVFPSNADHALLAQNTSWEFINVQGHVLTKSLRDDDDTTGVGVDEVSDLIIGRVRDCLPLDLPARSGFDFSLVNTVLSKISYGEWEDRGTCQACLSELHILDITPFCCIR